jgi:MFS family permease
VARPKRRPEVARINRWYYGWSIVALVVIGQMCSMGLPINCFSLFLGAWSTEFHAPISFFALAVTVFSLLCVPLGPFIGWCAGRFPARYVFGVGLGLTALFHVGISYAQSARDIMLFYAAVAPLAVLCSGTIPAQAVVSRWFWKRRGLAMGFTAFGLALAGVVFPPVTVFLIEHFGWRHAWLIFGLIIGLVLLPLLLLCLRDRPGPTDSKAYIDSAPVAELGAKISFGQIVRRRNFWYIGVAFLCLHAVNLGIQINISPLLHSYGYNLADSAFLISTLSISALVGKISCGALADRFGNRIPFVAVGLISAGSIMMLLVPSNLVVLSFTVMALGLTQGVWTLVASATATEFGPENFGQAYGMVVMFASVGSISPPVLAWLSEFTGNYRAGLLLFTVLALLGTVLAFLLSRKHNSPSLIQAAPAAV